MRAPLPVLLLPTLILLAAPAATALEVPFLSGRVNDYAELIPPETEERIAAKLEAFEKATGAQVAVLTIPSLEDEVLEEFSLRVAETWGLGREEQDDGVLLLVARDDRKMRIEVGYGLEGRLTDAQSGRILRNVLRPAFREGQFGAGIEAGVEVIVATLQGEDVIPEDTPQAEQMPLPARFFAGGVFLVVMTVFVFVALFSSGCGSWFLYLFLTPFLGAFPSAIIHPLAGPVTTVAWLVGFPIFKFWLHKTPRGKKWIAAHPRWASIGSGSGSGGGWSSGGGFSGGGGSFGGGGASGSW